MLGNYLTSTLVLTPVIKLSTFDNMSDFANILKLSILVIEKQYELIDIQLPMM